MKLKLTSVLLLASMVFLNPDRQTFGQETGPVATPGQDDVVPQPSECRVEPRTLGEMRELLDGTPAPIGTEYDVPSVVSALPVGELADKETIATVAALMNKVAACINADDQLRGAALYSDAYWQDGPPTDAESVNEIWGAKPSPELNDPVWIDDISDVIVLDDGRVAAVVTIGGIEDPHPDQGRTFMFLFVEEDGRWLIDRQIESVVITEGARERSIYVADAVTTPVADRATPEPSTTLE